MGTHSTSSKIKLLRIAAVIVTLTSIYVFAPWEFGIYYLKPVPETVEQELNNAGVLPARAKRAYSVRRSNYRTNAGATSQRHPQLY